MKGREKKRGKMIRRFLMAVLAFVFAGSLSVVLYRTHQYQVSEEFYAEASSQYTAQIDGKKETDEELSAPIKVDFQALLAENKDVVGWIYCEGTPIDYVVVQGDDNDQYLKHAYDGTYNSAGSIFIDANNRAGLLDCDTIIYGHHMRNGSMFAILSSWAEQDFYEEHPFMWFLTPEQDYRIELLSGFTTSAYSDIYTIYQEPCEEFDDYVAKMLEISDFQSDAKPEEMARYVLLSTCAYVFDDARHVLFGKLVPVGSGQI